MKTSIEADCTDHSNPARPKTFFWPLFSGFMAFLVLFPFLSLIHLATRETTQELWHHILAYTLPLALWNTVIFVVGVGCLVTFIGVLTAWAVTAYDFPGRKWIDKLLVLPLALPAYIATYAYLDLLHPLGPFARLMHDGLGLQNSWSWLDIRTVYGGIFIFGCVLYPYVYLPTRALFLIHSSNILETARTLGRTPWGIFLSILLPRARPALMVGVSLTLMETLNDIGAVQFLGVKTLTSIIYTTWIHHENLSLVSQLSLALLLLILSLTLIERWLRKSAHCYALPSRETHRVPIGRLTGIRGWLISMACFLPVFLGFFLPTGYLLYHALTVSSVGSLATLSIAAANTVTLSLWTTLCVVFFSFLIACSKRFKPTRLVKVGFFLTTFGYCIPGVVLGVAFLGPLSFMSGSLDAILHWLFPQQTPSFLLFGAPAVLVYAYSVRFFAPALHTLDAGLLRISTRIDDAARTLKRSTRDILFKLYGPMLGPSWIAAAFLVYLDCMKELPITLLLRGPHTETLATHLYTEVIGNSYETSAITALILILCGLASVVISLRLQNQRPSWL